jgi:hypothetical protein
LVLSLVAVSTVVVLAASFSQFASALANRQAQAVNRKRAFYMAEAGLAEAFAGVTCGKSGNVGSMEQPALLGDGVFWVEATEIEPGVVRLESTGMVGTGRAELAVIVQQGEEGVAALGAFSGDALAIQDGSLVDAYDSAKGSYDSQADKSGASLGTNGSVVLEGSPFSPTKVDGDVTPGTDQDLVTGLSVTITGSTDAALQTTELPPVEVPDVALEAGLVHASPYPLVIPAGSGGYEGLKVASGSQVVIQGPAEVVLGSLLLAPEAELLFDTTQGAVSLFVTDELDLQQGSTLVTSSARPRDVTIQVPGETLAPLALRAKGPFHGVFYAPETTVTVGGAFEVFGALVGKLLVFEGPAKLHFDKELARLAAAEALPKVLTWRLVELASSTGDLSVDPFDLLGVEKSTLVAPTTAHADQELIIYYLDAASVYHRYQGAESTFDWNVVKDVIHATRDGVEVLFPRATTLQSGTKKAPNVVPVDDLPML